MAQSLRSKLPLLVCQIHPLVKENVHFLLVHLFVLWLVCRILVLVLINFVENLKETHRHYLDLSTKNKQAMQLGGLNNEPKTSTR